MLDFENLLDELPAYGLECWRKTLEVALAAKLAPGAHGDLETWQKVLAALPPWPHGRAELDRPVIAVGPETFPSPQREQVRELLLQLSPWRKGPFQVADILIDAEWRSDLKWSRLEPAISPLANRLVLDVGCGNGYYALRMAGLGARAVIGTDPMLLYVMQHAAIRHFMPAVPVHVLPLRLQELPASASFDTVFSMGVLYHQRAPERHLQALNAMLKTGGELVLETLILPGREKAARTPERYARMKNVWLLPTESLLQEWLEQAGFASICPVATAATTHLEQRRTEWMRFESLSEALDPADPTRTVEGWPAPQRMTVVCRKPA